MSKCEHSAAHCNHRSCPPNLRSSMVGGILPWTFDITSKGVIFNVWRHRHSKNFPLFPPRHKCTINKLHRDYWAVYQEHWYVMTHNGELVIKDNLVSMRQDAFRWIWSTKKEEEKHLFGLENSSERATVFSLFQIRIYPSDIKWLA